MNNKRAQKCEDCGEMVLPGKGILTQEWSNQASEVVMDGEQVIYDWRSGYNSVGWLLTRTGNTLYLTSRSNLDGHDMSETYVYSGTQSKVDDVLWTMELI